MKVLVTGGCGFLGSHICEYFKDQHEEVVSYDNLTKSELIRTGYNVKSSRYHNWNFLKEKGVTLIEGDIGDVKHLDNVVSDADYIIHTAAQPAMTISIEKPDLDFDVNCRGTFNVLDTARKYDIPVVTCSSIHVYGNEINMDLIEDDTKFNRIPPSIDESYPIMRGDLTPLHVSKRCLELYSKAFNDTYGLKSASFRLTGMYGPRQFGGEDHGWVANFSIRTLLKLPITVFGTDKQVRDILYASDAAKAFDAYFTHQIPDIYNIGGGIDHAISIKECLQLIQQKTGNNQEIFIKEARKGDLWYFISNISKATQKLGWTPEVSNTEGISHLIDWIQENIAIFKN